MAYQIKANSLISSFAVSAFPSIADLVVRVNCCCFTCCCCCCCCCCCWAQASFGVSHPTAGRNNHPPALRYIYTHDRIGDIFVQSVGKCCKVFASEPQYMRNGRRRCSPEIRPADVGARLRSGRPTSVLA